MKVSSRLSRYILSLLVVIGALIFTNQAFADSTDDADTTFDYVKGELVVSVEADSQDNSMHSTNDVMISSAALEQDGFHVSDSLLDSIQSGASTMSADFKANVAEQMGMVYLIEYSENDYENSDQAKEELQTSLEDMGMDVRYVQENYTMHALEQASETVEPMDVHPDQEWNYDMINAPEAWDTTPGSSETSIAVLDTGIDADHQNLSDYVDTEAGKSFVGGDTSDGQGHGTHVAGTIASYGDVSGVMEEATLIPVKVLDDNGSGSMYDIQEGITYAAGEGADVINMSLGGGGYDQGMEEAIETANSEGTIVVAASGNDGMEQVSYPAAYDGAVAVGSVDSDEQRSDFSNYGPELDVMAPGSDIYSTVPGDGYEKMSGTSMATPHIAGVMGLIRSADPDISVDDARSVLNDTAQDAGSENEYGNGIADAAAAVQEADNGDGGEDPDPEDPDDPDVPNWEAYTFYDVGDEVVYDGEEYVCEVAHYSSPGWEPPYDPLYWSEK
ncbi:MAG TPA: S8 family serine peptidase [Virgibacillus sp.]|nr:S8 family serine peptidase [Virgibacillus sp.]